MTLRAFFALLAGAIIIAFAVSIMLPLHAFAADPQCHPGEVRASWYGRESCRPGRACRTASGEAFDGRSLTAAHKSLPLGTRLRVTARNGRSVVVRINDRGPFIAGRELDLSAAAAKSLGTQQAGVACVRMERL